MSKHKATQRTNNNRNTALDRSVIKTTRKLFIFKKLFVFSFAKIIQYQMKSYLSKLCKL